MVISGTVEWIQSKNDNNWTVFYLKNKGHKVKVTGITDKMLVGDEVEIEGEYEENQKWGKQFKASFIRKLLPQDVAMFADYLIRNISGVGERTARSIVRKFGAKTFDVIEKSPEELVKIPGISTKKAFAIQIQFLSTLITKDEQMLFIQLGISDKLGIKIKERFKDETREVLLKNPYKLIGEVEHVGFKTADDIAMKAGIPKDSAFRIRSGIAYTLEVLGDLKGHSYLPINELTQEANKILSVSKGLIETELVNAEKDKLVVIENGNAYIKKYYDMEISVASKLFSLFKEGNEKKCSSSLELDILNTEKKKNISLDSTQRNAVMQAVKSGVSIITGGPGVGKTTVLNVLIEYLTSYKAGVEEVVLMAPTGRAAKRMQEQTGREAQTIHRMIASLSQKNEIVIEADTVIVDEMSMVDLTLLNNLLTYIDTGTRIVLVGDVDQLPSVGVGRVLKDLIDSGVIPVTRLVNIYRQAAESHIIQNAHKINNGEKLELNVMHDDFFYFRKSSVDGIINIVKTLARDRMPKRFGITPFDVQILVPMRKGSLGMYALNTVMQDFLNPKDSTKAEYNPSKDRLFREGDKVIHIKNNYNLEWTITETNADGEEDVKFGVGVFNGDTGKIKQIDKSTETIIISYDDGKKEVEYKYEDMDEVELAYAMTIHKSQGSEFPAIIIPVLEKGHDMLYNRNLIYTGVTRARDCVAIIGNDKIIDFMAKNTKSAKRYSTLSEKIKEMFK